MQELLNLIPSHCGIHISDVPDDSVFLTVMRLISVHFGSGVHSLSLLDCRVCFWLDFHG